MSSKKGKKNKGKKVSLQEFVQEPGSGGGGVTQVQVTKLSWAEECTEDDDDRPMPMKTIELPTAPRAQRLQNDELVGQHPPYVAYMSNLPYEIEDDEIDQLLGSFTIATLKVPRDDSNKCRGFAVVEFEHREDLIDALSIQEPYIRGRRVKIDVQNENENRRDGRRNNRYNNDFNRSGGADGGGNWRDRHDGGGGGGGSGYQDGGRRNYRNRDNQNAPQDIGEPGSWRMGGGPYSPPPPADRRPYERRDRGDRGDRPGGGDRGGGDRFGGNRGGRDGGGGRRDYEPRGSAYSGSTEDLPAERPKLNLQPRTLPLPKMEFPKEEELEPKRPAATKVNGDLHEDSEVAGEHDTEHVRGDDEDESSDAKPVRAASPVKLRGVPSAKIFGDAKPVDTAAKEREIEEKLKQREQDAQRKVEEEKRKAAASEESADDSHTEKQQAPIQAATTTTTTGQQHESNVEERESAVTSPTDNMKAGDGEHRRDDTATSWRNRDAEDNRPRARYSPERDRGQNRRNDRGLRERNNYNRENNKYGRDNRNNYPRRDHRDDRRPDFRRRDDHHRMDRDRRDGPPRDSYREPKDVEERMPKYKPAEGPNLTVSNPYAGLVDEQDDQEE